MRLQQPSRQRTRSSAAALPREPGRPRRSSGRAAARDAGADDLLVSIGHELRNPLGAISAAAEVLQAAEPGSANINEARAVIARQTRLLGEILGALQELSRSACGRLALNRRPIDLAAIVREASLALGSREDGGAGDLQLDLEEAWVNGDAARLHQAIGHLMADVLHAGTGGSTVRVSLRRTHDAAVLDIRCEDDAGGVVRSPLAERRGAGALLARKLLEMHRACVLPGARGVVVRLPVIAPPGHAPHAPHEAHARRVLLIESDARLLGAVSAQLALDGHVVSSSIGGMEGLRRLLELNPAVCLVDLAPGGLTGFDVARHARACGYAGRLIALAATGSDNDERAARIAGFDAWLAVPTEPARLRRIMQDD